MTGRDGYPQALGLMLRLERVRQGLTVRQVEALSGGRFKAGVVSAYERGTRALTVERLHGLAGFYGLRAVDLLPEWPQGGAVRLADGPEPPSAPHGVTPGAVRASDGSTAGDASDGQEAA